MTDKETEVLVITYTGGTRTDSRFQRIEDDNGNIIAFKITRQGRLGQIPAAEYVPIVVCHADTGDMWVIPARMAMQIAQTKKSGSQQKSPYIEHEWKLEDLVGLECVPENLKERLALVRENDKNAPEAVWASHARKLKERHEDEWQKFDDDIKEALE